MWHFTQPEYKKERKIIMKKISIILLTLLLIVSLYCSPALAYDVKESDFDTSCVLVTIKKEYSAMGRTYLPEEFSAELVKTVRPLMYLTDEMKENMEPSKIEGFKDIIALDLKNPSAENVELLLNELKNNPLVDSAGKNYYISTGTTTYIAGDSDNNGILTASDARVILRISVNLEACDGRTSLLDTDYDNKITAADARYVLRASVSLEPIYTITIW